MSTVIDKLIFVDGPTRRLKTKMMRQTAEWVRLNPGNVPGYRYTHFAVVVLVANHNQNDYTMGMPVMFLTTGLNTRVFAPFGGSNVFTPHRVDLRPATEEEIDKFIDKMLE